jgi:hypothetical protein
LKFPGQVGHRHLLVEPRRDVGDGEDLLDLRSEQEAMVLNAVVEGPHAHRVAGREEPIGVCVPDREGKIPQEVGGAVRPPAAVGRKDEIGVGRVRGAEAARQRPAEGAPVVDPGVGDEDQIVLDERLGLPRVLGRDVQREVGEVCRLARPRPDAVRAAVRGGLGHCRQHVGRRAAAVEANAATDATHRMPRIRCRRRSPTTRRPGDCAA